MEKKIRMSSSSSSDRVFASSYTSLNIGGQAAASEVFDLPDAKMSHNPETCAMGPLLAWATSRDRGPDEDGPPTNEEESCSSSDDDPGI